MERERELTHEEKTVLNETLSVESWQLSIDSQVFSDLRLAYLWELATQVTRLKHDPKNWRLAEELLKPNKLSITTTENDPGRINEAVFLIDARNLPEQSEQTDWRKRNLKNRRLTLYRNGTSKIEEVEYIGPLRTGVSDHGNLIFEDHYHYNEIEPDSREIELWAEILVEGLTGKRLGPKLEDVDTPLEDTDPRIGTANVYIKEEKSGTRIEYNRKVRKILGRKAVELIDEQLQIVK